MATEYTFTSTDIAFFKEINVSCHKGTTGSPWRSGNKVETGTTVYFQPLAGYEIVGTPQVTSLTGTKYDMTYREPNWEYTYVSKGVAYKGFVIETRAKVINVALDFTDADIADLTVNNVTATINGTNVVIGTKLNVGDVITFKSVDGYLIDSVGAYGESGEWFTGVIASDNKTATFTPTEALSGFYVETILEPEFISLTIEQFNIDENTANNVNGFINDKPMAVGDTIKPNDVIKFVCFGNGVSFKNGGLLIRHGSSKTVTMNISTDLLTASYTWTSKTLITAFEYFINYEYPQIYIFDTDNYNYFTTRNAFPYVGGVKLEVGSKLYASDVLEIRCKTGYEFITGGYVYVMSASPSQMEINSSNTIASLQLPNDDIYSFDFTTVKTAIVNSDTTNNTYQITPRELRNLESLTLKTYDTNGELLSDDSNLLVGVMRYPFVIPDDFKGELGGIYIGSKQYSAVKATDINQDIIEIDLGIIETKGVYNNLLDYANTECILRLPHLNSVKLESEYVIDQKIGVKYIVNLINGETSVIITSDKLEAGNDTLLTINATIGTPIPIAHKDGFNYQPIDAQNMRIGGINYIDSPTIDIVRNELANKDSMFNIPVKDSGKLTGAKGWVKIDEIVLTLNATQAEKLEIINLLKTGVFFNE